MTCMVKKDDSQIVKINNHRDQSPTSLWNQTSSQKESLVSVNKAMQPKKLYRETIHHQNVERKGKQKIIRDMVAKADISYLSTKVEVS